MLGVLVVWELALGIVVQELLVESSAEKDTAMVVK